MVQYGSRTSIYVQDDLIAKVDLILARNPELFKSRSHFINCAVFEKVRRFDKNGKLSKSEERIKAADYTSG